MKKICISLLFVISVILVMFSLSVNASAEDVARVDFDGGSTNYTSLYEAINSCPDGGTVNVLTDCVLSQRANISSKSITILSDVDVTVTRVTSGTHGMITFGASGESTSRTLTLGGGLGTLTLDGELKTWSISAITVVNSNYNLITNKGFAIKNYVTTDRGAISIKTGSPTLTINDIVIDNCTSTRTSADKAGAIHGGSSSGKSIVINGGSITNCGEDPIIMMAGGLVVTNNASVGGNIFLYSSGLSIDGNKYSGNKLSIKLNYTPTVGTVIIKNNTDLNKFALVNSGYYLEVNGLNLVVTDVPSATPTPDGNVVWGDSGTDSAQYTKNSVTNGVIRFLQAFEKIDGITNFGFYFLNSETGEIIDKSYIIKNGGIDFDTYGGIYGDLIDIQQTNFNTKYYAKAFVTSNGTTYFSDTITGSVGENPKTIAEPKVTE